MRVSVSAPSDVVCVGDEDLIRRLVNNLVDNALRFSPPGASVDLTLERIADRARISVTDRGPGVPIDAQPHIFERFFRADKARSHAAFTESQGAGLGLAIAAWVAEAHGGTLTLLSSNEAGTTFVAELPCRAHS